MKKYKINSNELLFAKYLFFALTLLLISCTNQTKNNLQLPSPSDEELEEVVFESNKNKPAQKQPTSNKKSQVTLDSESNKDPNSTIAPIDNDLVVNNLKGWERLAQKLIDDGVNASLVNRVFSDSRMPSFENVTFAIDPKESHRLYTIFLGEERLKTAQEFYATWRPQLREAEKKYGVPAGVITAIMYVETGFGKNTGNQLVLNRLARLANIGETKNVRKNIRRLQKNNPDITDEQVINRASYLEKTFYPEVLSLFKLATIKKIDLLALKGSPAGAFGLPQFLPSSYVKFAVDGNANGSISLFEVEDAIFSVGNFLSSNGWTKGLTDHKSKLDVLWNYNRSEAYGEMILKVAERLN